MLKKFRTILCTGLASLMIVGNAVTANADNPNNLTLYGLHGNVSHRIVDGSNNDAITVTPEPVFTGKLIEYRGDASVGLPLKEIERSATLTINHGLLSDGSMAQYVNIARVMIDFAGHYWPFTEGHLFPLEIGATYTLADYAYEESPAEAMIACLTPEIQEGAHYVAVELCNDSHILEVSLYKLSDIGNETLANAEAAPANPAVPYDTFNYTAYADKYTDLKAAFGYDKQALYHHYITYGINEGRTVE